MDDPLIATDALDRLTEQYAQRQELMMTKAFLCGYAVGRHDERQEN